ncbi:hypothetical protein IQ15_07790 [Bradyrhizobium yuanmingense]|uniref:hypothetical protein n=1 Tax=Bradyrhizobium yuanmingense TaxID=108015 RepID=UPI000A9478A1|nr:hypothetical protein [Bradyrhizobium yuanmingense]TWI16015.1 hypothetical protein IQ15_07790 [Bradyrhizobium yuanmingense]
MTIRYLALLAPLLLGGCYGLAGHDEVDRYFQRSNTITMTAGDAKQVNAVMHTIHPGRDTSPTAGSRTTLVRGCRGHTLWQNATAGGSASRH